MNNIEVDESKGEMICTKCEGSGIRNFKDYTFTCSKCKGKGKLDWISSIMGEPQSWSPWFSKIWEKNRKTFYNSIYGVREENE